MVFGKRGKSFLGNWKGNQKALPILGREQQNDFLYGPKKPKTGNAKEKRDKSQETIREQMTLRVTKKEEGRFNHVDFFAFAIPSVVTRCLIIFKKQIFIKKARECDLIFPEKKLVWDIFMRHDSLRFP